LSSERDGAHYRPDLAQPSYPADNARLTTEANNIQDSKRLNS
jgi:hypothetical protein